MVAVTLWTVLTYFQTTEESSISLPIRKDVVLVYGPWFLVVPKNKIVVLGPGLGLGAQVFVNNPDVCCIPAMPKRPVGIQLFK